MTAEGKLREAEKRARPVWPASVTLAVGVEDSTKGQRYIEVSIDKNGSRAYRYDGAVKISRERALELIEEATA